METIKLEPLDDQDHLLEELNDAGNLLELQFGTERRSERGSANQRRKTGAASNKTVSAGISTVCRLCCLPVSRLTTSVNDKVIADFLNFVPELSLSDHKALSPLVCQQCFSKAKICVDFIQNIQLSQHSLDSKGRIPSRPVQSMLKGPKVNAQEILNKMKRIGGLNIKKVGVKQASQRRRDPDDDFTWPMVSLPSAALKKSNKTRNKKAETDSDSDEDYNLEDDFSDSDEGPSTSSSKRKRRSGMSDSDEDFKIGTQSKSKSRSRTEVHIAPPAKYSCGKCRNYFEDLEALMGHVKDKNCVGRGFPCEVCGKVFDANSKLTAHKEVHGAKSYVYCDQCGKELKDAFALEAHIEAVHKRVVRTDCVFRCSKCSDTFNSHLDLLNHVKVHKNSPTMPCEICGKEILKNSYHSHINWHRSEKNHSCDTCGKAFFQKQQLRNHMHNHNGAKQYPCDYCDKTYANGNAKRRHISQAHPEEIPTARIYKCKK